MRYVLSSLLLLLLLTACSNDTNKEGTTEDTGNQTTETAAEPDFGIKPGVGIGALNGEMVRADLEAAIGKEQVTERDFYLGEGESAPGLVLYADSPEEVEVLLDDDGMVILYRLAQKDSKWATKEGVKVGMSIQDLQTANGVPFKFTGFDWDYGGTVTNWNGGAFDGKDFLVVLGYNYDGAELTEEDMTVLIGDQDVMSDHPATQRYEISVVEIMQRY